MSMAKRRCLHDSPQEHLLLIGDSWGSGYCFTRRNERPNPILRPMTRGEGCGRNNSIVGDGRGDGHDPIFIEYPSRADLRISA